jgi:4-diphosphocytidyl-2-C-methyl-D-erythritol kinase
MGKRPDGYHEIETILHGIGLGDDIEVAASDGGRIEIEMAGETGFTDEMPAAADNLIFDAATRMLPYRSLDDGARIEVVKRIPVGAGLGGGSADAAATMVALNELWGLNLHRRALMDLAAAVGSDVPYFLAGGTCLATGRGEDVTPLPAPHDLFFVLGISSIPLITREVYEAVDLLEPAAEIGSAPMTLALGAGDLSEVASLLHNDLEPAAFELRRELADGKQRLLEAGALGASLSGSGPTLLALAAGEGHAAEIAARVAGGFDRVMVLGSAPESIEPLD